MSNYNTEREKQVMYERGGLKPRQRWYVGGRNVSARDVEVFIPLFSFPVLVLCCIVAFRSASCLVLQTNRSFRLWSKTFALTWTGTFVVQHTYWKKLQRDLIVHGKKENDLVTPYSDYIFFKPKKINYHSIFGNLLSHRFNPLIIEFFSVKLVIFDQSGTKQCSSGQTDSESGNSCWIVYVLVER